MSTVRPKVSTNTRLFQIAAYTGLIGSTSLILMKWYYDRKFRRSQSYVEATQHLLAYKPLVDLLGEPIYFGNVDFSNKENVTTESEAKIMIPVLGANNRGILYMKAIRKVVDPDVDILESSNQSESKYNQGLSLLAAVSPWVIDDIEVTINNRPGEKVKVPVLPVLKSTASKD